MIKNYFTIAKRNLWRNKRYSFINISGLAMGIAAFLLILEYIGFEKSINGFHKNGAHIYRLLNENEKNETSSQVEPGWAPKAKEIFPEIKDYCRFEDGICQGVVRREGDKNEPFREENIGYAEGNFFEFFSFPIKRGQAASFKQSNVTFLSQQAAIKYFGKDDPIGKEMVLFNQFGKTYYTVKGIYTIPDNSDIKFDMVFSLETLKNPANLNDNDWANLDNLNSSFIYTFFHLNDRVDDKIFENKLATFREEYKKEKDGITFRLQPLDNMHLASSLSDTYPTTGNLKYVYIIGLIALLILAIAWFNYVNLSTANSIKRANEVGVRKVIGASQQSLVFQFLSESLLTNVIGLISAIALLQLLQPLFNNIINKPLSLHYLLNSNVWIMGLALLVIGSLLSGAYTAFSLSSFNPVQTLKGKLIKTAKGAALRKSLVVAQFTISIVLILATTFIYQQLQFMQNKNLGINIEQVLVIRGPEIGRDSTFKNRKAAFMNGIAQQSFVRQYSQSGNVPGNGYNYSTAGFTQPNSKKGDELKSYSITDIDENYMNNFEIAIKAGRNFTAEECAVKASENTKVVLNERAIESLGFTSAADALQTKIQKDGEQLEIIGVVKNYHHLGMQQAIDPIVFYPKKSSAYFSARLTPGNWQVNIEKLETLYKKYFSGNPFEYFFADENFNKQYITEQQYSRLFTTASVWAIIIACLGLFGLTTYTIETRTKEIGIRKIMGASVFTITRLLSKDFLLLVLLAIIIACPLAWWVMSKWLQNFAYRIHIEWWVFALIGVIALAIAFLTVSFQAIKAAIINPVKSLRTE